MKKSLSNSFSSVASQFVLGAQAGFDATQATIYAKGSLGELGALVWAHYADAARVDGKLSAVAVFELLQADKYIDADEVSQSQNCKFVGKHVSTYKGETETYYDGMLVPLSWGIGDANGKARMTAAIKSGAIETRIDKDGKVQPKRFNSQHPVYAALVRTNPERVIKAKPAPRQTNAIKPDATVSDAPSGDVKASSASLTCATLNDWTLLGSQYMEQKPSKSQRVAILAKLSVLFGLESEGNDSE